MRCPDLKELPLPQEGKTGWPWTEESRALADTMPNGRPWPKISIITPNYNYGRFIEETIRSVLLQGYPELEYIIIDAKSTDNSVEIIRKYEKWITYWVSEPDTGHPHAVNKGMLKATGEILGYLNSDDFLMKDALRVISKKISDKKIHWISGRCLSIDGQGNSIGQDIPRVYKNFKGWLVGICHLPQPATFWTSEIAKKVGEFDERLQFCLDYNFFYRLARLDYKPYLIKDFIAYNRIHPDSKTANVSKYIDEDNKIMNEEIFSHHIDTPTRKWIDENNAFEARLSEIRAARKSGFLRLLYLWRLFKIAFRYPWVFLDYRLYSHIKHIILCRR